jgi:N-acetylglucosaminyldiphosphoundecaprenol N-acetyl-beta-D-mannosaminyltransferase
MSTLSATYKQRQKVLGYPVDTVDEPLALDVIQEAWNAKRGLHVVTLNAEMVVASQQDQALDRIIRHAHLIVPDGSGVVWALRLAGHGVNRLPGIELASAALGLAARNGARVALLGGKTEVLEKIKTTLPTLYPNLNIVASHNGYFSLDDEDQLVDQIADEKPDLLLVALGVPKQEYFIDRWNHAFPHTVMIGVGGSFDVWAGNVKRAPAAFRKMHLEWFYRLMAEPWRFKRMSAALPSFAMQVLQELAQNKLTEKKHGEKVRSGRQPKPHDKSKERSKDK